MEEQKNAPEGMEEKEDILPDAEPEAEKEAAIRRAEGEAEAILKIQQAQAEGIKMLNEANPDAQVIAIKSLESLQKVADGKSTKIIIPSEIQGLAGLATCFKELIKDDKTDIK